MENQNQDLPEEAEPVPYKSTFFDLSQQGVQAWVHEMNKPGPHIFENLKNWIARDTLRELLGSKPEPEMSGTSDHAPTKKVS